MGIFLEGEDYHGEHGLGRLAEFRFKASPGTTSSSITTHTPSGQRNCASWASQPQKSVTLLPCPGGRNTKSTKGHVVARLVEFRFKASPGTTSSSITTHTPWASQPQKSVTLAPCPGGRTTKSTKDMWWHWTKKKYHEQRGSGIVIWQWAALPMSRYIVLKTTTISMTEPCWLQVKP